jgi:rod shape-determining protein MreD
VTGAVDAVKALLLVFFAGLLQVSIVAPIEVAGGSPDVLLVTLVAVALLRGPVYGAVCGFFAGLIVDTATLETLGLTSLVLTVAGYWIGRYGETTGRDRSHAPLLSVLVITVLYSLGVLALHFMIGDAVSAGHVLIETMPPAIAFNVLLTIPIYALCRRLLRQPPPGRMPEVQLLG